jgi:dGTPase
MEKRKNRTKTASSKDVKASYVLLTKERARESTSRYESLLDNSISDRARVLYSSPFRRLQDKAQVFSLETNAAIRSRLTHSLEVAHIGRSIAAKFADSQTGKCLFPDDDQRAALVTTVETACLMHDLGNPPFGHFGETAIKEWFALKQHEVKRILGVEDQQKKKIKAFDQMYSDFTEFDGNPQTLRIVTRIQFNVDKFGLNLTNSQLAAVIKYPWTSYSKSRPPRKKFGVFHTEADVLKELWTTLKLEEGQRHLLVYLVEAADDISYCMSDIEDAIDKRVVTWHDFIVYVKRHVERLPIDIENSGLTKAINGLPENFSEQKTEKITPYESAETDAPKDWQSAMLRFRTSVTRYLIEQCLTRLETKPGEFLNGDYKTTSALLEGDLNGPAWPLAIIKSFAEEHLYGSRNVRQRELIAHRVIHGLLDHLFVLLDHRDGHRFKASIAGKLSDSDGKLTSVAPSVASLLPRKYLAAYDLAMNSGAKVEYSEIYEWGQRAHLIVDYVSGMTDRFALDTYRLLLGIDTNLEK